MGCFAPKSNSVVRVLNGTKEGSGINKNYALQANFTTAKEVPEKIVSPNKNKVVRCFTMKKQENNEDMLNVSLEGALQKDLNEKPTAPTNSKFNKMESKSEEKIKELIDNLGGKNLDMNKGILSDEDIELIKGGMREHFLFSNLSEEIIDQVISQIIVLEIKSGLKLFKEGENGNFFYIVKNGLLELRISDKQDRKIFKAGDTFGELALIQKNKRSGTVECVEDGIVFCLEGSLFREIVKRLNKNFLKERIYFLSFIPLFKGLNAIQIQNLATNMIQCEFREGQTIVKEGDKGESLFIIKEGTVACVKDDKEIRRLHVKDYFGESSILFETKRTLSIISKGRTLCYNITKSVLEDALGQNFTYILLSAISKNAFLRCEFLHYIVFDDGYSKLMKNFKLKFYKNNEVVIDREHYKTRKIIILIEGNLIQSNNNEVLCQRGGLFGESLLRVKEEYVFHKFRLNYEVVAVSDCIGLESSWGMILKSLNLENDEKKVLSLLTRIQHLKKVMLFKNISDTRLLEIVRNMEKKKYEGGEAIIKENSPGDKLYFLYKGTVRVMKNNKQIRELEEGNVFGETSLILNENHSATILATSQKVSVYTLSKQNFFSVIDKKMREFIIRKISLQDNFNTNINDLYYLKSLGQGKFGSVSLVHNTKNLYAIKAVHKAIADKNKLLIKYFQKERRILLSLDHPFIITLVKTLKGPNHIFYLMEYVNGIVMSKYIEEIKNESNIRNIYETQFYIAQMLITLDYLNKKNIAHRDIKPDNIMINDIGYIKMIDFGTAIMIKDFTNTLTGTPNYIAPEVLLGKGYSFSADYWSIGITAFELFFNFYPFGNNALDPMEVYRDILRSDLQFPKFTQEEERFCFFVSSLLRKKVSERVCHLEQLKEFKFFEDFNFNEMTDFRLKPPFVPDVSNNIDHYLTNTKIKYTTKMESMAELKKGFTEQSDAEAVENDEAYDSNWADEF